MEQTEAQILCTHYRVKIDQAGRGRDQWRCTDCGSPFIPEAWIPLSHQTNPAPGILKEESAPRTPHEEVESPMAAFLKVKKRPDTFFSGSHPWKMGDAESVSAFASSGGQGVGSYEPVSASDYHAERAQWDATRKTLERDNLKMKKLLESIIRNDEEGCKLFAEIREALRYV